MNLTEHDVIDIAKYVRIALDDQEVGAYTRDINAMLELIEPITQQDFEGVEPTFNSIGKLVNVMRADVPGEHFTQEEALSFAKNTEAGAFRVPTILGGGEA